jgi:hypothetical protein
MLINKELSLEEVIHLEKDRHVKEKYHAFRGCDVMFQAMLNNAEGETHDKPRQQIYLDNVACVGNALCPQAYAAWLSCMQVASKTGDTAACELKKRQMERCIRSETQNILRISQNKVFRSGSGPRV